MRQTIMLILVFITFLFAKCKKGDMPNNGCTIPAIVPFQPYSDPVWHPNAKLLGFNYTPLTGIGANGTAPCIWYSYFANPDSTGFYIMNKDGTGFKRITNYNLYDPSWSPDGNWLAFMVGAQIYKMRFTGNGFDTTSIIQLTDNGSNFFPSWTANSDTIYYDSNIGTNNQGYYIWKMAGDGSGKTGFPGTGREPFVGSDNRIYYVGLHAEIFSMNLDGSNPVQITFNGNINGSSTTKSFPVYYNGKIYYQQNGLWFSTVINSTPQKLNTACETYDISRNGEIVYGMFDYGILNRIWGTLWIMNADGSNKRQLTFNNFK